MDGTLYFVMGYVKGESLAARLKREGRLPVEESRRILIEIADALDYAHKLGVIHRDIKPDNVLLEDGTGRALLTDFGVAKALGAGQTMTEVGSVLGTPHYMSPEQAQGKADIDHRSDIYSLGVMGYAMLAGRLPFEGPTAGDIMVQHITKEPPSLKSLAPDTPVDIASALTRSLAKNPKDRWPDARGLKAAISESNDAPVPAPLLPIWRGTQALAVGGYCTALVWVNAVMTPESTDPLASRLAIDALPRLTLGLTMIGMVGLVGAAFEARKLSHSWVEILHAARLKPAWWLGWYPAHWRARADVWDRLPIELRRARSLVGWGLIVMMVWFPSFLLVSINASNLYRTTGRETVLVRVDRVLKSKLGRGVMAPPITLVALGFFFAWRWKRSRTASQLTRGLAGEAIGTDTAHRTFWSRPEVAALLLPPGSAPNFSVSPARTTRRTRTSTRSPTLRRGQWFSMATIPMPELPCVSSAPSLRCGRRPRTKSSKAIPTILRAGSCAYSTDHPTILPSLTCSVTEWNAATCERWAMLMMPASGSRLASNS